MKRLAFNGGEISPNMALRSDMDGYARSCSRLENFDIAQTGGITRRRGMRPLAELADEKSVLIPYTYDESHVYLIELYAEQLIVRDKDGNEITTFSGEGNWSYSNLTRVTWLQINAVLLLLSANTPVMELRMQGDGSWEFGEYEYKMPPWYTVDARETKITISPQADSTYRVSFDAAELADETQGMNGDLLRASYYTQQQEAFAPSRDLRVGIGIIDAISPSSTFEQGAKIAMHGDTSCSYWVCTADWEGDNDFVAGLTMPSNYPENFLAAEDLSGFDEIQPIYGLAKGDTYTKGTKIAIQSGYWELYTCIKAFAPNDYRAGKSLPSHYPSHFIRGIAIGDALACKGTWSFYCSGTWHGCYEVRRCYDGKELDLPWESRGESFSRIGSSSNEQISGNEEEEECWLRLFLTRTKYLGHNDLSGGWPSDTCSNRLIVPSYKHDMLLRCQVIDFENTEPDISYDDETPILLPLDGDLITQDWSWAGFSARYGYPTVALLHESRLILAATAAQPQTLWFSATDDLNNFSVGELDSSGMLLTMATATQAGICWGSSRGDLIMLGTEGGEWCIKGTDNGVLTPKNIRITNYGYNGSAHIPAVHLSDNVLYCERGGSRIYEYGFNYDANAYISTDRTIFADHIATTRGGIVSGTAIRKPSHKAVFVLADGTLALMTYNSFHNVNAWHRYITAGTITAACALPDGQNSDRLFLITTRDGIRYLEVIDDNSPYTDGDGLDYTSTMETTAFALPDANDRKHLSGQMEVYIASDTPAESVTTTIDGREYAILDKEGILPQGWNNLITVSDWTHNTIIGIRCQGETPLTILAIQA